MPTRRPDIIVEDHGTIAILRRDKWIEANVSDAGYQQFGLGARLAELRCACPASSTGLATASWSRPRASPS